MLEKMKSRRAGATSLGLIVAGVLTAAPAARAAASFNNFFAGGGGAAGITAAADAPGDNDGQSIELKLRGSGSFAGLMLNVSRSVPGTPPSFTFRSSISGPSQGSPRVVMTFSDGAQIALRPLRWVADAWIPFQGSWPGWESTGSGGCPALRDVTYGQAVACHVTRGASVTGAYVVADGVSYAPRATVYLDNLTYGGTSITSTIVQHGAARLATTSLRVRRSTGRGSLITNCNAPAGDRCRYQLKLKLRGRPIGSIAGTVQGGVSGGVAVRLNDRGRALLRRAGTLHAIAAGTVLNDVGFGFQLLQRVTIRG